MFLAPIGFMVPLSLKTPIPLPDGPGIRTSDAGRLLVCRWFVWVCLSALDSRRFRIKTDLRKCSWSDTDPEVEEDRSALPDLEVVTKLQWKTVPAFVPVPSRGCLSPAFGARRLSATVGSTSRGGGFLRRAVCFACRRS